MKTQRLTRKQREEQSVIDIVNEMFKIAGHNVSYEDVKGRKDDWFNQWTMTEHQYNEWLVWGKKYLQKKLRMYAKMAEREIAMMGLMWGLRFTYTLDQQYDSYCSYASKLEEPDYKYHVDDPNANCTRLMTKEEFAASELHINDYCITNQNIGK